MRLFAGIPVPEPALSELVSLLEQLRGRNLPVRWVRDKGIHLTLKFFGQVGAAQVPVLSAALADATEGFGPFGLAAAGLGSFPPGRRAKIVWIGVEAPSGLEVLQHRVERACERVGCPVDGRPFQPHITLGRVTEGSSLPARALAGLPVPAEVRFLADRVVLYESRPARGGSIYSPVSTIELTPCPVV